MLLPYDAPSLQRPNPQAERGCAHCPKYVLFSICHWLLYIADMQPNADIDMSGDEGRGESSSGDSSIYGTPRDDPISSTQSSSNMPEVVIISMDFLAEVEQKLRNILNKFQNIETYAHQMGASNSLAASSQMLIALTSPVHAAADELRAKSAQLDGLICQYQEALKTSELNAQRWKDAAANEEAQRRLYEDACAKLSASQGLIQELVQDRNDMKSGPSNLSQSIQGSLSNLSTWMAGLRSSWGQAQPMVEQVRTDLETGPKELESSTDGRTELESRLQQIRASFKRRIESANIPGAIQKASSDEGILKEIEEITQAVYENATIGGQAQGVRLSREAIGAGTEKTDQEAQVSEQTLRVKEAKLKEQDAALTASRYLIQERLDELARDRKEFLKEKEKWAEERHSRDTAAHNGALVNVHVQNNDQITRLEQTIQSLERSFSARGTSIGEALRVRPQSKRGTSPHKEAGPSKRAKLAPLFTHRSRAMTRPGSNNDARSRTGYNDGSGSGSDSGSGRTGSPAHRLQGHGQSSKEMDDVSPGSNGVIQLSDGSETAETETPEQGALLTDQLMCKLDLDDADASSHEQLLRDVCQGFFKGQASCPSNATITRWCGKNSCLTCRLARTTNGKVSRAGQCSACVKKGRASLWIEQDSSKAGKFQVRVRT